MKRLICIGLVTALSVTTVNAAEDAAASTPEGKAKTSIETRQGLYKVMAFSMAPIGAMLRNSIPFDAAVVAKNSERIEHLAAFIPDLFQNDTRKFTDVKTQAVDGIWTSQADFKVKADDLAKTAQAVTAAAKTGDKGATLKAAAAMGKACGNCHDTYRPNK